jgi:hypothetical protein
LLVNPTSSALLCKRSVVLQAKNNHMMIVNVCAFIPGHLVQARTVLYTTQNMILVLRCPPQRRYCFCTVPHTTTIIIMYHPEQDTGITLYHPEQGTVSALYHAEQVLLLYCTRQNSVLVQYYTILYKKRILFSVYYTGLGNNNKLYHTGTDTRSIA